MRKKYKLLFKNLGLLTISNFGSKILVLLLIPLYTSVLSSSQYGTFDLYSTTISLLTPILTLNIVHAVMRFCIDNKYDSAEVIKIGIKKEVLGQLLFMIMLTINYIFNIIPVFNEYIILFYLLFLSQRLYTFLSHLSRGLNKIFVLAVGGVINSIIMLLFNILFLIVFKLGLTGYFIANVLSYFVPSIYMFFGLKLYKYRSKTNNASLKKEMTKYSMPMIFSTLGWWINNVSDRYIIIWMCGIAANGVYSIAYKVPSMLNIVHNIFNQAWAISATQEYDKNSDEFYTKTYSYYNLAMVIICSFLIILNKVIAKILFNNEFYLAWKYAPFLIVSILFTGVFGYLEGVFIAAKDTKIIASSACLGALVNIILNIILIFFYGPIGAAISTMISSIIIWIIRIYKVKGLIYFSISLKRDVMSYVVIIIQAFLFIFEINRIVFYAIELLLFFLILILYKKEIESLISFIKKRIRKKKKYTIKSC